ncbi:hypothetical protein HAHE_31940 [Haloferula helveola]|uniref:Sialate O-acetylesterase domain-containing protein n=1 Tax=Haloferula helveola TaxID=490095 RepID=A0ABM7RC80_9BACT|nr:hypothetical protein HAHE_31940 [Haloferula helveola]
MKRITSIALALVVVGFASAEPVESSPPAAVDLKPIAGKPCRLFLLGGQSNMDGCGKATELPEEYRKQLGNVMIWDNRRKLWVRLTEDTTAIARKFQFGPEMAFAHRLSKEFPDETIALMKTSAGGTKLHTQWLPGKGMHGAFVRNYEAAAADLEEAGIAFEVGGMLWMQGESDSETVEMANAYEANLKKLVDDVRERTGKPALPIVVGRISSSLLKKTPWNFDQAAIVQAAQESVAKADPNIELVQTDDLPTLKDNTHFNSEGQLTLGNRMADAMLRHRSSPAE